MSESPLHFFFECPSYVALRNNLFLPLDLNSTTRGHSLKLTKMAATKACRANYFSRRVNNAWNSLPDDVVTAPTLDTFKALLDRVWSKYHYTEDPDWFKNPKLDERKSTIFG